MAKEVDNQKGFLVLEVSMLECVEKIGGMAICDSCNNASYTGYYIAVLNHWVCPECYDKWMSRAIRYEEDIRIEERNYKRYCGLLGVVDTKTGTQ